MTTCTQPATKVGPACRADPNLWHSEAPADRRLAIHICQSHCLVRDWCAALADRIPCAHAVQAGVVHNRYGERMEQQPKPSSKDCAVCCAARLAAVDTRKPPTLSGQCGTYNGYRRHTRRHERSCVPCLEAKRLDQAGKRAAERTRRLVGQVRAGEAA